MDIDKTFEELYEGWKLEKEARTYKDRADDDEKKKKKHFAFGGKKKSRHGESGYGKGEGVEVDEGSNSKDIATMYALHGRASRASNPKEKDNIVKYSINLMETLEDN